MGLDQNLVHVSLVFKYTTCIGNYTEDAFFTVQLQDI